MKCLKVVKKLWGIEEWLVNDEHYCAKYLWISSGFSSSLHYHPKKRETFIVVQGAVELEVLSQGGHNGDTTFYKLETGDTYTIEPGVPHRFRSCGYVAKGTPAVTIPVSGACVLEVSTPHSDSDVKRLEESKKDTK